jgi:hypothetical protein
MRLLVFLAVILTIGVFLYYYHPNENPIDWFAKQQPQAITADSTAQNQPAPQPPRAQVPKSLRDKFYKFAEENNVKITNFVENPVGQVLLTAQSNDKNNIFDFMDAVEKGIDMRDITNVPGGYSVKLDADGRTLVTSTMKIRYTPQY